MYKYFFVCFSFIVLSFHSHSQQKMDYPEDSLGEQNISTEALAVFKNYYSDRILSVHPVFLSTDSLRSWKAAEKYRYNRNLDSLLRLWKKTEENKLGHIKRISVPGNSIFDSGIIRLLVWLIAIAFVGFILYHLFINKGLFSRDASRGTDPASLTEEELFFQSDYDKLIHQAILLGDYRVASRYYFLKTLYQLNENKFLEFSIDKTNLKYYYELPVPLKPGFMQLSRYYEFIWYGNVAVSAEQFKNVENEFIQFSKTIIS